MVCLNIRKGVAAINRDSGTIHQNAAYYITCLRRIIEGL